MKINRRASARPFMAVALTLLLAASSCGQSGPQAPVAPALPGSPAVPAAPLGIALPAPLSLVTPGGSAGRQASSGPLLQRSGSQWDSGLSARNTIADGSSAILPLPVWLEDSRDPGGLAIALYRFNLSGYTGLHRLLLEWSTVGQGNDCYLAVADFSFNRWRYYSGAAFSNVQLGPNLQTDLKHSPSGDMLVLIICIGAAEWTLDSMRVGLDANPLLEGVDFSHPPCVGRAVSLFPRYAGPQPTAWEWDLSAVPDGPGTVRGTTAHLPEVSTAGSFAAQLTVTDSNGAKHSLPFQLDVMDAAKEAVAVEGVWPGTGHSGAAAEFHAFHGRGAAPAQWSWDFGGGATPNTSADRLALVTLGPAGTYAASVTATSADGVATVHPFELVVAAPGDPLPPRIYAVISSPLAAGGNASVRALNSGGVPDSIAWTCDAGVALSDNSSANPTFIVPQPGIYSGSVSYVNAAGSGSHDFRLIVAAQDAGFLTTGRPVALWTGIAKPAAWDLPPGEGAADYFDLALVDEAGGELDCAVPGVYACARHIATASSRSTVWFNIEVQELKAPDITAVFLSTHGVPSAADASLDAMQGVTYTADSYNQGGPVDDWDWQFGLSASPPSSSLRLPGITFDATGLQHCTVTASNAKGSSSFAFAVTVKPPPPPYIVGVSPAYEFSGRMVNFGAAGDTLFATDWEWDFGGACTPSSSTERTPEVELLAAGIYLCSVKASNSGGSSVYNFFFTVLRPPAPQIHGVSPVAAAAGELVDFAATFSNEADSWEWDFGGGCTPNTSADEQPQVETLAPGFYDCSVTASSLGGSHRFHFLLMVE